MPALTAQRGTRGSTSPDGPCSHKSTARRKRAGGWVDLQQARAAAPGQIRQISSGGNHARRADHQHEIGVGGGVHCGGELGWRQQLAEPDDVGPHPAPAVWTARRAVRRVKIQRGYIYWRRVALAVVETAAAMQAAVQPDHVCAAGALVQVIHVLRDDLHLGQAALEFGQRQVAGVGLGLARHSPPVLVPVPHQFGVGAEGGGRGQLLRIVARPQAVERVAEGGHAGLAADA
jgi:hypothetical protein